LRRVKCDIVIEDGLKMSRNEYKDLYIFLNIIDLTLHDPFFSPPITAFDSHCHIFFWFLNVKNP